MSNEIINQIIEKLIIDLENMYQTENIYEINKLEKDVLLNLNEYLKFCPDRFERIESLKEIEIHPYIRKAKESLLINMLPIDRRIARKRLNTISDSLKFRL